MTNQEPIPDINPSTEASNIFHHFVSGFFLGGLPLGDDNGFIDCF